jgi:hypothetical protein
MSTPVPSNHSPQTSVKAEQRILFKVIQVERIIWCINNNITGAGKHM